MVTKDLYNFGSSNIAEASKLLTQIAENGYLEHFCNITGIELHYNTHSDKVFISNSKYEVAMLNSDGKLETFFACPTCGFEGFVQNILDDGKMCCDDYLLDRGVIKYLKDLDDSEESE
jgi:hypothetical protein